MQCTARVGFELYPRSAYHAARGEGPRKINQFWAVPTACDLRRPTSVVRKMCAVLQYSMRPSRPRWPP